MAGDYTNTLTDIGRALTRGIDSPLTIDFTAGSSQFPRIETSKFPILNLIRISVPAFCFIIFLDIFQVVFTLRTSPLSNNQTYFTPIITLHKAATMASPIQQKLQALSDEYQNLNKGEPPFLRHLHIAPANHTSRTPRDCSREAKARGSEAGKHRCTKSQQHPAHLLNPTSPFVDAQGRIRS